MSHNKITRYNCNYLAVEPRSTISTPMITFSIGAFGFAIRYRRRFVTFCPINFLLTWTVVKLGVTIYAGSISSNPAIATSSGTIYPCSCNTFINKIANSSFEQISASGFSGISINFVYRFSLF